MTQAPARILVVDDETPIRTTLADILRRRGHDVTAAASGAEAMSFIHERGFELLLLDLRLPDMSGIDIAERAHDLLPDAAMIILTGHGSLESALDRFICASTTICSRPPVPTMSSRASRPPSSSSV